MASRQPAVSSLAAANQQQTAQLRAQLLAALAGIWLRLGSWRETDIERFVRLAVPLVQGAQTRMSALTAAYLSRQVALTTGEPLRHAPAPTAVVREPLRGVPLAEEYARPFHDVWTALHDQKPLPEAVQAGQNRLTNLAATDLQLAKTHSARAVMDREPRIAGYRRVLEGPHSCGLCIVASTQRYHKADLMPIHPGCDCSVWPIVGDSDPGLVINEQHLGDVHQAIADTFGRNSAAARDIPGAFRDGKPIQYSDVLVTHHHGEIGPVLAVRGNAWTGPSDLHPASP